ncbi:MAG: O-antigen polymerase [Candidatus Berkelbacteria bacterium Licking1014_7]|uniref:O-antigen polymerase n=1 Tax=Candidatus Berkelbacteria bacterium Licking1014_7 TaxID=2017147 RepID=A0A554LJV0_9BACT|nr:MAG: O-antigen polymerase [Candidatus Berkelbacteria bacterium Licking1014_7]
MNLLITIGLTIVLGLFFYSSVKISRETFWGVMLMTFFLPFERIPTAEIAGFTLKINHILGILLIIFWLLKLLFTRQKIAKSGIGAPILLIILAFLLSFYNNQLPLRSVPYLALNLFVLLIFLIFSQCLSNFSRLNKIQNILIVSLTMACIFGIFQFFGDMIGLPNSITGLDPGYTKQVFGFPRPQAFSREPLYFGNLLLLGVGFCFAMLDQKKKIKYFYPSLIIFVMMIFATLSRGAIIGLLLFLFLWTITNIKKITPKIISYLSISIILIVVLSVGFFSFLGSDLKTKFLNHLTIKDLQIGGESTQGRLLAYQDGWQAFKSSPITGVGIANFGAYKIGFDTDNPSINDIINNEYLEMLAETGVIGFAAFMILLFYIFWRSIYSFRICQNPTMKNYIKTLSLAMLAILFQYNFFSTFSILHIWVGLGILVAVQNMALANSNLPDSYRNGAGKSQNAKCLPAKMKSIGKRGIITYFCQRLNDGGTIQKFKIFYLSFVLFMLPTYLVRFTVLSIPTTLLEILIWVGFAWSLFNWREWRKLKSIPRFIHLAIALFLLGALVGVARAPDKISALGQFKGFILDPLLLAGLVYIWTPKSKKALLYDGLILSGIILSLISLWQKLNGAATADGRVMSVWQWDPGASPNYLSMFLAPIAVLAFCLNPNLPARRAGKFGFVAIILGIIFSGSRAGLLAVGAGILFWLVASNTRKIKINRYLAYTILMVVFLAVLWWTGKPDFSVSPDSGRISSSNNIRWEIWRVTIREILPSNQNWLWGAGLGNFQNYFTELTAGRVNFPEYISPRALTPHNLYLHLWLSGGIIMLAGFLYLIWSAFKNPLNSLEKSVIFSILIYGLIDTPIFKNDLGVIWWLMIFTIILKNEQ